MLIFIDTEFTNFKNPELISIGLVSNDWQHEFYAELPIDESKCSDFVIQTVLPLLGKKANAKCTPTELTERLACWLAQFSDCDTQICYDSEDDWHLLCQALNGRLPAWLMGWNIQYYLNPMRLNDYFILYGLDRHHALNDAKANRYAFTSSQNIVC